MLKIVVTLVAIAHSAQYATSASVAANSGEATSAGQPRSEIGAIAFLLDQDRAVQEILAKSPSDTLSPELRQEVKNRINMAFDFAELGRLSLGNEWNERSQIEQNEFIDTFRQIVEEKNFDSFVRYYREGNIEYLNESMSEGRATVQAEVPLNRERIAIIYHLHRLTDRWRIFDLAIDGVGTAEGNRRQYARYIQRHSFEKLLQRLNSQLEKLLESN